MTRWPGRRSVEGMLGWVSEGCRHHRYRSHLRLINFEFEDPRRGFVKFGLSTEGDLPVVT